MNKNILMVLSVAGMVFTSGAMASQPGSGASVSAQQRDYAERTREKAGQAIVRTGEAHRTNDKKGSSGDIWMDSVMYYDIGSKRTHGKIDKQIDQIALSGKKAFLVARPIDVAADVAARAEKQYQGILEAKKAEKQKKHRYFAGGYCRLNQDVEVSKSSEFALMQCWMDFGGGAMRNVSLFAGIYPDYQREMLIGIPYYGTMQNGSRAAFNGIMFREDKGSINVASYVDSKRIRKLLGEGALATNDIAHNYASAYMKAKMASKVTERIGYITVPDANGTTRTLPVKTTTTEPPVAKDYFMAAGVEIFSKIFSIFGKQYLYDTTPLFRMYRGSRYWVEGIFEPDNGKLASRFGEINSGQRNVLQQNNGAYRQHIRRTVGQYGKFNSEGTAASSFGGGKKQSTEILNLKTKE